MSDHSLEGPGRQPEQEQEPQEPQAEPQDDVHRSVEDAAAGDPRVDAALRRAAELANTPPSEHVAIYEDVHRTLQEVLADAAGAAGGQPGDSSSTGGDAPR